MIAMMFLLIYHNASPVFSFCGMQVSRLGFGCGGLSGIYNAPLSHEDGCSIIKEVFNRGVTFFDTSDLYGHKHDNEIMVGKVTYYPIN